MTPIIQKAQFEDCIGAASLECSEENFGPIGTGPYVVEDFRVNDVVTYTANPNFREEGKPYFSRQVFKGGGDAESAARAVLETGEADYAWNLQISPAVLSAMEAAGNGTVIAGFRQQCGTADGEPDQSGSHAGCRYALGLDGRQCQPASLPACAGDLASHVHGD